MFRKTTLSLLLLVSIGIMVPFASSTAHGIRQSIGSEHRHHYRRHSRTWWRRYRARMKRRREAALAHRNAPLAPVVFNAAATGNPSTFQTQPKLPAGWNNVTGANRAEMKFRTDTGNVAVPGEASLSVVALSRPNPAYLSHREQGRMLAGTAFSDLRRIVIDKMLAAGGWVVNDYERQVTGYRVFVVTAQTPNDGRWPEKSWIFYFTEVNGRIYSLTTNTPLESANRMELEAERFIASLHAAANPDAQNANR